MAAVPAARRQRGFSLIELMITVIVLAVVSAIALPNFTRMIRNNRVATQSNEMLASLALARTEAIRQNTSPVGNRDVVLCPSADGATCGLDWGAGWIVASRVDDTVQTVLRHTQSPEGVTIAAATTEIVFDNRGRRRVGPDTLTMTPTDCYAGDRHIRRLTITASGQVRMAHAACP